MTTVPAPTLTRLTEVELRKMTDTRAGRWLLAVVALVAVALVVVTLAAAPQDERRWGDFFASSQAGVAVIFPVLGILAVTGEWSQRTALTTFALVPDRHRVLGAKLTAGAALAALGTVAGLLFATIGRAVAGATHRAEGGWSIPLPMLGSMLLAAVLGVTLGVAFGLALMNAPLAIVAYFLVPTVWGILSDTVESVRPVAGWLDPGRAMDPLYAAGITAGEWARLATAIGVWLLLPLLGGAVRLSRTEVH
ncbi:ABC transporter permease [Streptomyces sp. SID3343]|uniref:ABC transporter permease n=1 Tax=Streptomyces sp. SID3343 TaxID=2690260 RepID=UPI00136C96F0|nr:ABC transporter permease [Streptomyces sp. SID3343]MYW06585.1 ABC transporter permease [Streptomyces sp. SID3343]